MVQGCLYISKSRQPECKLSGFIPNLYGSARILLFVLLMLMLQVASLTSYSSCLNSYTLDWNVPSGYTVDCGSVNPSGWKVSNSRCRFYTPVFNVGVSSDGLPQTVDFVIRVNQSGNLDADDSTMVLIMVNGAVYSSSFFTGNNSNAVFSVLTSVMVPDNGTYQVQIICSTNSNTEFWTVKSGDLTICLRAPAPLPVDLIDFDAVKVEKNRTLLRWSTSSEKGNDYFLIEKSDDGSLFKWLGTMRGQGTTSDRSEYTMNDYSVNFSPVYYRLSQVDFNGEIKILKTILHIPPDETTSAPSMWVHRANGVFSVKIKAGSNKDFQSVLEIHSGNGALLTKRQLLLNHGLNEVIFEPIFELGPGMLIFVLTTSNGSRISVRYPIF